MHDKRGEMVRRLVKAADEHGVSVGDSSAAAGDLEILFGVAFRSLSKSQVAAFFRDAAIQELLEIPEYEEIGRDHRLP